jgi:site-specific DNA-adenine methylase
MTLYAGGKKRIGEELSKIIHDISLEIEEEDGFKIKGYCEPFCGMMGVYQYIPELFKNHKPKLKYEAGDRNPYLIKLWKGLQKGFKPPEKCSKKEYYKYKEEDSQSLKAIFLGFACAMRGVFRSTYFSLNNIKLQSEHAVEIAEKVKDVKLKVGDYSTFSNLKGYIIYCDPPYKNSGSPYSIGDVYDTNFDYDKFVEWCLKMSEDNIIFVSEYTKPCKESKLVWKKNKERLFLI